MNDHEQAVADALARKGWTVLRRGWPDLLCVNWTRPELRRAAETRDGLWSVMAKKPLRAFSVELKAGSDQVTEHQAFMHVILRCAGMPCHVVREDGLDALMRKKGTVFTAPEARQTLIDEAEKLKGELERKYAELKRLHALVEASTVLFDFRDPSAVFTEPTSGEIKFGEIREPDKWPSTLKSGETALKKASITSGALRCSFCNKSQREVKKLIAGPTAFVCDECVDICREIIAEDLAQETQVLPPSLTEGRAS